MTSTISCDSCLLRGLGCADCVVGARLDDGPATELGPAQLRALAALSQAGVLPPLRHLPVAA